MINYEHEQSLVRAFVLCELHDFRFADRDGKSGTERRSERAEQISAELLRDLQGRRYGTVTFKSVSNLGYEIRSITLLGEAHESKTHLEVFFDTATPGRYLIRDRVDEAVYDVAGTFRAEGRI